VHDRKRRRAHRRSNVGGGRWRWKQ